jgi:CubicO group peptidase (beta-lactamase class C family)
MHPAYPLRMSARDMARFGLLYLRGGAWRDRTVVPEAWVKERIWLVLRAAGAADPGRDPALR